MVTVVQNVTRDMREISCYADNGYGTPMQASRTITISREYYTVDCASRYTLADFVISLNVGDIFPLGLGRLEDCHFILSHRSFFLRSAPYQGARESARPGGHVGHSGVRRGRVARAVPGVVAGP